MNVLHLCEASLEERFDLDLRIGSMTRAEATGASSDAPAIGSSALVFGAVVGVPPILLGTSPNVTIPAAALR